MAGEGSKIHAAHYVPAGRDRFRGQREIQFTRTVIDFKVSTLDTNGGLSVAEITSFHKGGPARHSENAVKANFGDTHSDE